MAWTYRLEFVTCGKRTCAKLHGPYWYAYAKRGGVLEKRYVGKAPRVVGPNRWTDVGGWRRAKRAYRAAEERAREEHARKARGRAHAPTPRDYELVGGAPSDELATLRKGYRRAITAAHPDKPGGSTARAVRVNLAWERIQKAHGARP